MGTALPLISAAGAYLISKLESAMLIGWLGLKEGGACLKEEILTWDFKT